MKMLGGRPDAASTSGASTPAVTDAAAGGDADDDVPF